MTPTGVREIPAAYRIRPTAVDPTGIPLYNSRRQKGIVLMNHRNDLTVSQEALNTRRAMLQA